MMEYKIDAVNAVSFQVECDKLEVEGGCYCFRNFNDVVADDGVHYTHIILSIPKEHVKKVRRIDLYEAHDE